MPIPTHDKMSVGSEEKVCYTSVRVHEKEMCTNEKAKQTFLHLPVPVQHVVN